MLKANLRRAAHWLTRHPARFFAVFAIILMWPILLNGGPFYFGDSPGYLNGGKVAVHFAADRVQGIFSAPDKVKGEDKAPKNVAGVRSVAYSVFAYLTRAPGESWLGTCVIQALALSFVLTVLFGLYGLFERPATLIGFAALTALFTPAAWFAVLGTPDIFAGIAILAIGLLMAFPERLSLHTKLIFGALVAFTVCFHLSHVPLVGALVALSGVFIVWRDGFSGWKVTARRFAWIAVPALIGLGVTVAINVVGFHKASVTGNRYPIVLASSIQAGPARWYLEKHCATEHYAVCEVFTTFPKTSGEFLWGKTGVRARATPEQAERIRLEEPVILKRAVAAYPLSTAKEAVLTSLSQMVEIGLYDHNFGARLVRDKGGNLQLFQTQAPESPFKTFMEFGFRLLLAAAIGATVGLIVYRHTRLDGPSAILLSVVIAGCVINAVVCGALSAVTDRYQGRVVWVFLVSVALIWWHRSSGLWPDPVKSQANN